MNNKYYKVEKIHTEYLYFCLEANIILFETIHLIVNKTYKKPDSHQIHASW